MATRTRKAETRAVITVPACRLPVVETPPFC